MHAAVSGSVSRALESIAIVFIPALRVMDFLFNPVAIWFIFIEPKLFNFAKVSILLLWSMIFVVFYIIFGDSLGAIFQSLMTFSVGRSLSVLFVVYGFFRSFWSFLVDQSVFCNFRSFCVLDWTNNSAFHSKIWNFFSWYLNFLWGRNHVFLYIHVFCFSQSGGLISLNCLNSKPP